MTNFERIKEMNKQEMTEFLKLIEDEKYDYSCEHCAEYKETSIGCSGECRVSIDNWLKAPVSAWMPKQ